MKIKHILFSFFLYSSLFAQNTKSDWDYNEQSDSSLKTAEINFVNCNRIDDLLDKKKRIDTKENTVRVYRIQIFSGSRKGSTDAKNKFRAHFPEVLIETSYEQPYFKTKVAAFRTRLEAEKALKVYKSHFKSAFIYEEKIAINKL